MTLKKYDSANRSKCFAVFTVVVILLPMQGALTTVMARDEVRAGGEGDGQKGDRPTAAEPLYTREGADPSFAAVLKSGGITPGERFSKGPVLGSRIDVNHELLEKQVGKTGPIPKDIGIHTQGAGGIRRRDFDRWTRWYQEDGNTQVFRLFEGEQNVRGGAGTDGSPGRIEAFSRSLTVAPGTWHEWEGTYTVVEPVGAAIFQLFHEGSLWAFHIQMSDRGAIYLARRRPKAGEEKRLTLAENMVGKSLGIKVRANGVDYEVYRRTTPDGPYELMAEGSYIQARDNKISFRWGMYVGSRKGESVPKDAMLFVTGATVR